MRKVLFGLCVSGLAALASAHNGNDGFVTLNNFQLWSNTYNTTPIKVVVGDGYYNPSNCSNATDGYMVSTALPEEVRERIYSTLLAASMAKKSVVARIENNGCESTRPAIMAVMIQ